MLGILSGVMCTKIKFTVFCGVRYHGIMEYCRKDYDQTVSMKPNGFNETIDGMGYTASNAPMRELARVVLPLKICLRRYL